METTAHPPASVLEKQRTTALRSAIVFRDCSFRKRSTDAERRACRTLMRDQAVKWRRPGASAW
jgi:hypothetical protein